MTNAKIIATEVVLNCDDEVPIIVCPFCSQPTITFGEDGFGDYTPCEHMLFFYDCENAQFEYASEETFAKLSKLPKNSVKNLSLEKGENLRKFADELMKFNQDVTIISETFSGEECGPEKITSIAAFDKTTPQQPAEIYL